MSTDHSVPLVSEDTRRAECPRSDSCHENVGFTSMGRILAICWLVMAMVFALGKRDRVVFIPYNTADLVGTDGAFQADLVRRAGAANRGLAVVQVRLGVGDVFHEA